MAAKTKPAPAKARASSFHLNDAKLITLKNQIMIVLADYQGVRVDRCERCHELLDTEEYKKNGVLPDVCPKCDYRHVGFSTRGEGIRIEVADRIINNLKYIAKR